MFPSAGGAEVVISVTAEYVAVGAEELIAVVGVGELIAAVVLISASVIAEGCYVMWLRSSTYLLVILHNTSSSPLES